MSIARVTELVLRYSRECIFRAVVRLSDFLGVRLGVGGDRYFTAELWPVNYEVIVVHVGRNRRRAGGRRRDGHLRMFSRTASRRRRRQREVDYVARRELVGTRRLKMWKENIEVLSITGTSSFQCDLTARRRALSYGPGERVHYT